CPCARGVGSTWDLSPPNWEEAGITTPPVSPSRVGRSRRCRQCESDCRMPEGFLVVDKSSGMTSHDVVARVRRAVGVRKVGHAGTLDPMATGVVVTAIGRVTRLLRFVQELPKEYEAVATFGVATDSLDADGAVLE